MAAIPATERKYILIEKKDETPEVLTLKFTPEDGQPCPFEPGMFMMIAGVDEAGKKYIARAFSIASDPSTPGIEFMVIKEPRHGDHIGKSHFVDAKIGDVFMLKGPSGQFRFNPATDKKVGFIAGGTGLAPFTSMLRHISVTNSQNDAVLFYSTKYSTEIIWKDELNSYVTELGLKLVITVTRSQPGDGWVKTDGAAGTVTSMDTTGPIQVPGPKGALIRATGHVDAPMITKYAPDFLERGWYICGPLEFVKATKDALTSLGVAANKISADVWG